MVLAFLFDGSENLVVDSRHTWGPEKSKVQVTVQIGTALDFVPDPSSSTELDRASLVTT